MSSSLQHLLEQPLLVLIVVDGEVGGEAESADFPAQDAHAGGVEGAHPGQLLFAEEPRQPRLHLGGRLVGEGDRQDAPGRHLAFADQPGDPVGEGAGLAGAGARQDQQGAVAMLHRLALGGVESGQQVSHRPHP